MQTAMTEGGKKSLTSPDLCSAIVRMDSTMMTTETVIIRKQKNMLPAVSMRALPEGNFRPSTRFTARLQTINVRFDIGSNSESAMVVNSDNDLDDAAA